MTVAQQVAGPGDRSIGVTASSRSPRRSHRRRRLRALGIGLLFIAPTFALLAYFMYYPAYIALAGSFTQWDGLNAATFVGLDNFRDLFADPVVRTAAANNVVWALGKIVLSIVPPLLVAELVFNVRSGRLQYVYRTLFIIPIIVPSVVTVLLWTFYYRSNGLVNQVLGGVGLGGLEHSWLANEHTALWALILMGFPWVAPFNLLIFYAGLQAIPREITEAASLDGAGTWRRVWNIDIPMLRTQTGLLLTLAIIGSVQAILEPLIMTSGGPNNSTMTPILYLYQQGINYGQFGYSMAISLVLFVIVLILSVASNRLSRSTTS